MCVFPDNVSYLSSKFVAICPPQKSSFTCQFGQKSGAPRGLLLARKMLAALAGICYAMAVANDGCRWENDVLCGGTRSSPLQPNDKDAHGNGAHDQQQQEKLTPYELEKKNDKENEVQPTIFTGGDEEQSVDDSRKQTKKLKSKYTGCRWENDVHCGGTAAFPGDSSSPTAPPTKAEIAAEKKKQLEKPTPFELEMENEKDNEVKPTIFDVGGSPPEHSLDDGHDHNPPKHSKASKHSLDDGHEHTAKSAEAAAAAKERTEEKDRAAAKERSHLKRKYTGCRWANDVHCGGTESARPGANGREKAPADTEDRPDEPSPYDLEMENGKDAANAPQIFDDSASPSVQIFGEDDVAEPSVASSKSTSRLHSLGDGHDHAAPGDRGIGQ